MSRDWRPRLAALGLGLLALAAGAQEAPAPRINRHALIIGVGQYRADPARPVEALQGVGHDMASARAMAAALQVPASQITELRDGEATRERIEQAVRALAARTRPGDRVFVYWTGHGSRFFDPQAGGCVETLIPWDLQDFTYAQFASLLKPVGDKADKLFVVYDACHSGGVGGARPATRALGQGLGLQPKSSGFSAQCAQPTNVRSRGFAATASAAGMGLGDVLHIASSRPDELSFDSPATGGLATSSLRQCLLGGARDLDGSGAISGDELVQCAQDEIDRVMKGAQGLLPQHLTLAGNRGFVPAQFAAAPPGLPAPSPTASPAPPPPQARPIGPHALLEQVHAQRDHKRTLRVTTASTRLRIGRDGLDLLLQSPRDGHAYVAMAGSDGSLSLLFPNALDADNRIAAGQQLLLPRPAWRVTAGGPAGRDRLLVMVSDAPRDLAALQGGRAGPFLQPLLDSQGRARLQWLLGQQAGSCQAPPCSDAFASELIDLDEVP